VLARIKCPGTLRSPVFFFCEKRSEHGEGEVGSSSTTADGRKVWKALWSIQVPEKVKVFTWKVINNGIPTQANKCYRHIAPQATCEMCGHWREDCFHAYVQCPHAVDLRQAMREHWVLLAEEDLKFTGPEWLLVLMSRFSAEGECKFAYAPLGGLECA
jgi:hypothetical protein